MMSFVKNETKFLVHDNEKKELKKKLGRRKNFSEKNN